MAEHSATVIWHRASGESFTDRRYSRVHEWQFDGGTRVVASASPHVVPLPFSQEAAIDPEEAFVASLAICHMLFFLSFAAARKWQIERYEDAASGTLAENANGQMAMTEVTLRPKVIFAGEEPSREILEELHHLAHEKCFIANSVKTKITVEKL